MEIKRLSIDEALSKEDVNTFHKAERRETETREALDDAEKLRQMRAGAGRPKKTDKEKAKARTLYINDEDFETYKRLADMYGMNFPEWAKMVLQKEVKRERGI